jgi:hypothetical protein
MLRPCTAACPVLADVTCRILADDDDAMDVIGHYDEGIQGDIGRVPGDRAPTLLDDSAARI